MTRFIFTLNASGVEKLIALGAKVHGKTLAFDEDNPKSAHIFYRRYMRNFHGVILTDQDYSAYTPHYGTPSQFGFKDRPQ